MNERKNHLYFAFFRHNFEIKLPRFVYMKTAYRHFYTDHAAIVIGLSVIAAETQSSNLAPDTFPEVKDLPVRPGN